MMKIRPVTDLRNKFTEIEKLVKNGEPVYLTKNGHGIMVVMSMEHYSQITDDTERMLDETDRMAAASPERFTHDQVFKKIREVLND